MSSLSPHTVSSWVCELEVDDLPQEVLHQLRRAVLDALGSAIAGACTPAGQIAAAFAERHGRPGASTVLGTGGGTRWPNAVLANGVAANAWDIDDGYRPSKGHPGGFIVMPALAAGQESDGSNVLPALAAGYEVACRAAVATHRYYTHYHASGSWGGMGTVAACGKVTGLDAAQMGNAFGLAEYHAALSPIERCLGTPAMTKDGIGWGAYSAACAVDLAADGFTGNPSMLDAPENADLMADLGEKWCVLDLYFKPYPCCRWAQQGVDALIQLRRRFGFAREEVARVTLHTFREATLLQQRPPRTTEEAQYHLFWPMAVGLVHGDVRVEHVAEAGLHDPEALALLNRMEAVVEPELQAQFPARALASVEVTLNDGTVLKGEPMGARGDVDWPLSDDELTTKFMTLIEPLLGPDARRLSEIVWRLGEADATEALVCALPEVGAAIAGNLLARRCGETIAMEGGV